MVTDDNEFTLRAHLLSQWSPIAIIFLKNNELCKQSIAHSLSSFEMQLPWVSNTLLAASCMTIENRFSQCFNLFIGLFIPSFTSIHLALGRNTLLPEHAVHSSHSSLHPYQFLLTGKAFCFSRNKPHSFKSETQLKSHICHEVLI